MSEETEEKGIDDLIKDSVWPEKSGRENSKELIFENIVPELWETLKLKGKSDSTLFEAFLIKVIVEKYEVKIGSLDKKNRSNAKKRDSCLLAFGLLRGYYHTNTEDGNRKHIKLDDRRIEYLNSSDFTMIDYGRPYKDIEAEEKNTRPGRQPKPLNTLNSSNIDRVDEMIKRLQHLVKWDRVQSLMDGADTFVQSFILSNGEIEKQVVDLIITEEFPDKQKVRRVVLPEPIYTLANFPRQPDQNIKPVQDNPQEDPQSTIKDGESLPDGETISPDEIVESLDEAPQVQDVLEEKSIADYINAILESNSYDDVGVELYQKLCHTKDEPPYSEWVATWLLKCIRECFETTMEADVLLAVFALLPGYQLKDTNIRSRLEKYIFESEYVSKISYKKYKTMEAIETPQEKDEIRKSLRQLEIKSITKLVKHIENISDPCNHIKDLSKYGKLDETRNVYCPRKQQLKLASNKISFFRLFLKKHIIKIAAAESIMIVAMLIYILYNWQRAPQSSDEPQRTEEIAENERPKVESITVKPDFIPLQTGETYPLSVSVRPVGAYADLAYKSENEQIATVSSNGEITAQGNWRENEYIGTNITVWAKNIIEEEICDKTFVLIEKPGNEDESHEYISQKSIPEQ